VFPPDDGNMAARRPKGNGWGAIPAPGNRAAGKGAAGRTRIAAPRSLDTNCRGPGSRLRSVKPIRQTQTL
jgi:hypothetical protein